MPSWHREHSLASLPFRWKIFFLWTFGCLFLKPDNFVKLFVTGVKEAIEVLKNYLGNERKGMSYSYIIIYRNSKNDIKNNCNINFVIIIE